MGISGDHVISSTGAAGDVWVVTGGSRTITAGFPCSLHLYFYIFSLRVTTKGENKRGKNGR